MSCATRRSPTYKDGNIIHPIAGTNAPPRNASSYFAPLARRRRAIPAASLSLRPGIGRSPDAGSVSLPAVFC
ncbi:hypothetical protein J4734_19955 [Klebsiella pneumoniae]|uniref:Uncharacterized protein n=1 Tax=Klebsiella pneumoniae TaxID=573 RepID=A0A939SW66_KLEPN|nr:hypothetical protein [Klebsiella pneumoniae]